MSNIFDTSTENAAINTLKRALYYEVQYRNAIVSDSLSFFDANISKDIIENDFFYKDEFGDLSSVLSLIGLSAPCRFSELVKKWAEVMIPDYSVKQMEYLGDLNKKLLEVFAEGKRDFTIQYWIEPANSEKRFINHKFLLTRNENDEICALSILKDYTNVLTKEEKARQQEIEQYAYFDPVTKGYNYIKFKEKINKLQTPGIIISMDIHSFKVINSICGVVKGDEVLKSIWESLLNSIEIEKNEVAAHVYADHFIIFIPSFENKRIIQILKNITFALNLVSGDLEVPQLLPYFGISSWDPSKKIELAYSEAVAARHNAREQQAKNYSFFEEKDTARLVQEKRLIDSFEDALARKEFKIWYQPKFSPVSKKLVGAEALVRWITPDGSMISPGVFIPVFEKNGLIRVLDEYIFRNVCIQQKKWQDSQIDVVPVSINLSRASLYYRDVVLQYKRIASETHIPPSMVPIEITETAAINNIDIKTIADDFYKAGFSLHMDDFGSGYSSLSSLNVLHFDTLKLDKSLIDYIGNFGGDRLLEHTICLAKELGIHVTAEGVENEAQVRFLHQLGVDSIQGYLYSKPLPQDDYTNLLKNRPKDTNNFTMESVIEHISHFNHNFIKPAIYNFICNLTKNEITDTTGDGGYLVDSGITASTYDDTIEVVAEKMVAEKDKIPYKNFMNRQKILANFCGTEETRIFQYDKASEENKKKIRIVTHTFKISSSDDIWMYFNTTPID